MTRLFPFNTTDNRCGGSIAGKPFSCAPHGACSSGVSQNATAMKTLLDFPSIAAYATNHLYRAICNAGSRCGRRGDYFVLSRSESADIDPRLHILAVPGLFSPAAPPGVSAAQPPRVRPSDPSSPPYPSTPRSRRSVRHHSCHMNTLSVELLSSPLFFVALSLPCDVWAIHSRHSVIREQHPRTAQFARR